MFIKYTWCTVRPHAMHEYIHTYVLAVIMFYVDRVLHVLWYQTLLQKAFCVHSLLTCTLTDWQHNLLSFIVVWLLILCQHRNYQFYFTLLGQVLYPIYIAACSYMCFLVNIPCMAPEGCFSFDLFLIDLCTFGNNCAIIWESEPWTRWSCTRVGVNDGGITL